MKKKLSLRKKKKVSLLQSNIKNTLMSGSEDRPKLMSDVASRNYLTKHSRSGQGEDLAN